MPVPSPYASLLAEVAVREGAVTIDGRTTRYWDYGPQDAPVVVLAVHGFRGEHHGLEPVIAHLRGIRVISPDLPGFGSSEPFRDRPHDIAGYGAWLARFAELLDPRPSVLLGHSFGSIVVAAAVAEGIPAERVVLVNPIASPALEGSQAVLSRLTLLYYRLARVLPRRVGESLLSSWIIVRVMSLAMVHSRRPDLRRWVHDQHHRYFSLHANRDSLLEGFQASISTDVSMVADRLTVPVLLVAAAQDPISTVADQRRLAASLPDAILTVIDDVGHLVHYERPREAAEAIVAFLGAGAVAGESR